MVKSYYYRNSSHATTMVSFVIDRMKMKEVSLTDCSQYYGRGRWLVERYTLTAKLFNVPSGDHTFKLYLKAPNGYHQFLSNSDYTRNAQITKLMMIGYPEV